MPEYMIKLLRRDDSVRREFVVILDDENECGTYLVENHGQTPAEVWLEGERIMRRVSPAHDLRSKGYRQDRTVVGPTVPSLINRWSLHQFEQKHGLIGSKERNRLETAASCEFQRLRETFSKHPVWVRADTYPLAPPSVDQHVRFSFGISRWEGGEWEGWIIIDANSRERDGEAILADMVGLIDQTLNSSTIVSRARAPTGVAMMPRPQTVRVGLFLVQHTSATWRLGAEST